MIIKRMLIAVAMSAVVPADLPAQGHTSCRTGMPCFRDTTLGAQAVRSRDLVTGRKTGTDFGTRSASAPQS